MKYLCEFSAANGVFFVIIPFLSFLVLLASFLIGFVAHAQYQPFSLAYQPQKTYYRAADPSTSTPNETVTSATSTAATPNDQQPPPTPLPTTQPNQPSASNDDLKSSKLQSMVQQLYTAQGQVRRPTFEIPF